jgi:nitroreductase
MTLSDAINTRRAVRKYGSTPVSEQTLREIQAYADEIAPLHADINLKISILPFSVFKISYKAMFDAPCFAVISSEKKPGYLENAGYVGERLVLKMTAMGLATCWVGGSSEKQHHDLSFVIAVAFGNPAEDISGPTPSDSRHKTVEELCYGELPPEPSLTLLRAARLAPSGVNLQPVRYFVQDGSIHVYRKNNLVKVPRIENMQRIDTGIALAHLAVQAEDTGLRYSIKELPESAQSFIRDIYVTSLSFERA